MILFLIIQSVIYLFVKYEVKNKELHKYRLFDWIELYIILEKMIFSLFVTFIASLLIVLIFGLHSLAGGGLVGSVYFSSIVLF
jgi:hypothetical protein